jgi:pyridoxamine-phosphate oxidase
MPNRDYHNQRRDYNIASLNKKNLPSSPFKQLVNWLEQVFTTASIQEPTAMTLATVGLDNQPHCRIVLLKKFNEQGLLFYTHYDSNKGRELETNPKASCGFFWSELDKQIRIEGRVEKISAESSDKYFNSRPKDSQLAAYISKQSQVVKNRADLENKMQAASKKFADINVPRPKQWGGYRLIPHKFEFWQGRPNRLHDRFVYEKQGSNWSITRLAP